MIFCPWMRRRRVEVRALKTFGHPRFIGFPVVRLPRTTGIYGAASPSMLHPSIGLPVASCRLPVASCHQPSTINLVLSTLTSLILLSKNLTMLQYDNSAFYFFALSFLTIYLVPCKLLGEKWKELQRLLFSLLLFCSSTACFSLAFHCEPRVRRFVRER